MFRSLPLIGLLVMFLGALLSASALADATAAFPAPRVRAWQTGLARPDRLEHASLSLTLGLGVGLATERPATAFGSAFALGLAKELWDAKRTRFDPVDLLADFAGAGLSAWLTRRLEH